MSRQQWGGTVGGPIALNRVFFFGGYQGTRVRVNPPDTTSFVPTAAMMAGDFTQVASAQCNGGTALTLPLPFVDNRVAPSLFSPVALNLMQGVPISTDPCGRIELCRAGQQQQATVRVGHDYQMTDKQRLFGRYFVANYDRPPGYDGTNVLLASGNGLGLDNRMQEQAVNRRRLRHLQQPPELHPVRARPQPRAAGPGGHRMPTFADLGSNVTPLVPEPGLAFYSLNVTNGFPGAAFPGTFESSTYQLSQDFDWVKGAHQLAFGGQSILPNFDGNGPFQANGIFTFNGSRAGAQRIGFADMLLGLPSQYRQGGVQDVHEHMNYVGAYAQDTWRVSGTMTISGGLRWEPYYSAVEEAGYASHFSMDNFMAGVKSTVIPNAPAGLMFPGDPGFPGTKYNKNKLAQFAPRLGIIWDPNGDGRQTIRAAGGIFYESPRYVAVQAASR